MTIIERVARVLAGQHFSRNAEGAAPVGVPASELVDRRWPDYVDDAVAVLKTLREPDDAMRAAAATAPPDDVEALWDIMIRAAVREHEPAG